MNSWKFANTAPLINIDIFTRDNRCLPFQRNANSPPILFPARREFRSRGFSRWKIQAFPPPPTPTPSRILEENARTVNRDADVAAVDSTRFVRRLVSSLYRSARRHLPAIGKFVPFLVFLSFFCFFFLFSQDRAGDFNSPTEAETDFRVIHSQANVKSGTYLDPRAIR